MVAKSESNFSTKLGMLEMSLSNERLTKNRCCQKITAKPGVTFLKDRILLTPSQYFPNQSATLTLDANQAISLLRNMTFHVLSEADSFSKELPEIGQRVPTKDRRKKIAEGWRDDSRTQNGKILTITAFLFNSEISDQGIVLKPNSSVLAVTDGAGRLSTALDEINKTETGETTIMEQKKLKFQFNIYLLGDKTQALQEFLSCNRDAKRASKGTTMGVETALLAVNPDHDFDEKGFLDPLASAYVAKTLYSAYQTSESILELFPWSYEGRKSESSVFRGRGKAPSVATAIKNLAKDMEQSGIKVKEMPSVLDFVMRIFYKHSREAVKDAHAAAISIPGQKKHPSQYHLHSTLALKVMFLLAVRIWPKIGRNEREFTKKIVEVLQEHFRRYKSSQYHNYKSKVMTIDKFWQESKWFNTISFNSGEVNTSGALRDLRIVCDDLLPLDPNKKPSVPGKTPSAA